MFAKDKNGGLTKLLCFVVRQAKPGPSVKINNVEFRSEEKNK